MTSRLYKTALVLLVLYWLAIFIATHIPAGPPRAIHVNDKLQHMLAYLVLTILLNVALGGRLRSNLAWVSILIVLLYGAVDEALQPLVGRTADLMDWFADAAGAAVGVCICGIVRAAMDRCRRSSPQESTLLQDALR